MWNKIPDKDWAQLGILLRRPWFERVWVIQEVLSAREALVFNGLKSISFSTLVTAAFQLALGHNRFPCDREKIAENIQSLVFLGRSQSFPAFRQMIFRNFYMALWATRSYKSTDARDKIYAIPGLSLDTSLPPIKPDYKRKTAEVFTHFTATTLSSGSLTPLGCTTHIDDNPQLPLPSWVPDWTRTVDRMPFGMLEDVFSASRDSSPSLRVSPDYKVLTIKGQGCMQHSTPGFYDSLRPRAAHTE
jgi:hypothetical protein